MDRDNPGRNGLETWINTIGGRVTDVEANGQCGWLALYAAAHNVEHDELEMTAKTILEATQWKKRVLNVLLASLNQLVEAKVIDLTTEQGAQYSSDNKQTTCPSVDALAMYWDAERRRSVDIPVPESCWVNMTVLHGATLFLREPVYVLDVHEDGNAHLGMYAYRREAGINGKSVDMPFFVNIHADKGLQLLKTLRANEVRPVMLILTRKVHSDNENGPPAIMNHFKAVTFSSLTTGLLDTKAYGLMVQKHKVALSERGFQLTIGGNLAQAKVARVASITATRARQRAAKAAESCSELSSSKGTNDDHDEAEAETKHSEAALQC